MLVKIANFLLPSIFLIAFFWANQNGLALTNDSADYLAAAKSFASDFSLQRADGSPFVYWSPLYPIFLAFLPLWSLKIAHALAFLLLFWVIWLFSKTVEMPYRVFYVALFSFSTENFIAFSFVWTEAIFLALWAWYSYFFSEKRYKIAIILGFLMLLQRNAGIFLIAGLFFDQMLKKNLSKTWLHFLLVVSGFLARNSFVSYFYENKLAVSWFQNGSFFQNYQSLSLALADWFFPKFVFPEMRIFLVTILLVSIYIVTFKKNTNQILEISYFPELFYLLLLVFISPSAVDLPRFLTLIFPFLLLRSVFLLKKIRFKRTIFAILCVLLLYTALRWAYNVYSFKNRTYPRLENAILRRPIRTWSLFGQNSAANSVLSTFTN